MQVLHRPHPPSELRSFISHCSVTPKEREWCWISIMIFITSTSASLSFLLSKRKGGAPLQIHGRPCHPGGQNLFNIFENSKLIIRVSESMGCPLQVSPLGGDLEGAAWVYFHRIYIRMPFKIGSKYDPLPIRTKMNIRFQLIIVMFHIY